jgi:YggT family protein
MFTVLSLAIFGRVLLSWISPKGEDPISALLIQVTEPVLYPIRRVVPALGMFDLSPMIALILLNVIRPYLVRTLGG